MTYDAVLHARLVLLIEQRNAVEKYHEGDHQTITEMKHRIQN